MEDEIRELVDAGSINSICLMEDKDNGSMVCRSVASINEYFSDHPNEGICSIWN